MTKSAKRGITKSLLRKDRISIGIVIACSDVGFSTTLLLLTWFKPLYFFFTNKATIAEVTVPIPKAPNADWIR